MKLYGFDWIVLDWRYNCDPVCFKLAIIAATLTLSLSNYDLLTFNYPGFKSQLRTVSGTYTRYLWIGLDWVSKNGLLAMVSAIVCG